MSDHDNDIKLIVKAMNFAAKAHTSQMRKDGVTPYINHPIGVANILTEIGNITDLTVICAALLHDTVEDTDTTFEDIRNEFGERICSIVAEVTDDKLLPSVERKRLQILNSPMLSKEAKLVRLADKLYNLRDLLVSKPIGWSEQRVEEYFEWAAKVISGLKDTNSNIESELRAVLSRKKILPL